MLKKSTSVTSYSVEMSFQIHTKFLIGELSITLNRDFIYTNIVILLIQVCNCSKNAKLGSGEHVQFTDQHNEMTMDRIESPVIFEFNPISM